MESVHGASRAWRVRATSALGHSEIGTGGVFRRDLAELEECTGREVATSAVYIALRRLEKKGLLSSRLESPEQSGEPYPRRYFALTEASIEPLRAARRSMLSLWEGLEPVLDD